MVLFSSATSHGRISVKYLAISLSHFPTGLFDAFLLCLEFFAYSGIYYVNFEVSFQILRFSPILFTRSFTKKGILILLRFSSAMFLFWNSILVSILNSSLRLALPSRSQGTGCLSFEPYWEPCTGNQGYFRHYMDKEYHVTQGLPLPSRVAKQSFGPLSSVF